MTKGPSCPPVRLTRLSPTRFMKNYKGLEGGRKFRGLDCFSHRKIVAYQFSEKIIVLVLRKTNVSIHNYYSFDKIHLYPAKLFMQTYGKKLRI